MSKAPAMAKKAVKMWAVRLRRVMIEPPPTLDDFRIAKDPRNNISGPPRNRKERRKQFGGKP